MKETLNNLEKINEDIAVRIIFDKDKWLSGNVKLELIENRMKNTHTGFNVTPKTNILKRK